MGSSPSGVVAKTKMLAIPHSKINPKLTGIRIARTIVKELGHPIISTSLPGDFVEEYTDPELIYEKFEHLADIVINAGIGKMTPSTVIDCTLEPPEVIRAGAGVWEE